VGRLLDLSGQRFGRLVAVSREDGRWLCRCDCGGTNRVVTGHLREGTIRSCGCLSSENSRLSVITMRPIGQAARNAMRHKGTVICTITSRMPNRNSTTGVRGVSLNHSGRYRAYLTLQQRQISLGVYDTIEEARLARKAGEEKYYAPVIESFEREVAGRICGGSG
jgi:hypothetical protein